jgi:hypothetical protein
MAAPGFMQRMLMSKLLGELVEFLPEPARDALIDLRDYVQKHGRLPKFDPLRSQPLAANEHAQAIGVFLGALPAGASLKMINLLRGELSGGAARGVNVIVGDITSGEARGVNMLLGNMRGGLLRGGNLLMGDVHGGEVKSVYAVIGNVHGGSVKCYLLLGDVHGGTLQAKLHVGKVHGGNTTIERTIELPEA